MDDFLIGPQSDENYTWWDYEMEYGDDNFFIDDDNDEISLINDLASSTKGSR